MSCSRHVESFCPATGEVHLQVPDSGEEEVELAVRAAEDAFKTLAGCSLGTIPFPFFPVALGRERNRDEGKGDGTETKLGACIDT